MLTPLLPAVATFAVCLLGGLSCGSVLARRGGRDLPVSVWAPAHRAEDGVFRVVMPPALFITLALTIAAAVVTGGEPRTLYGVAAALVLVDLLMSAIMLVPINRAIAAWPENAPPSDWRTVRDRWARLHASRSAAALLAAMLAMVALVGA